MTTLTADRFPTLALVDHAADRDGHFLGRHATQPVDGCQTCHVARRDHGRRYSIGGWHQWVEPGTWLRKVRILSRRRLVEPTNVTIHGFWQQKINGEWDLMARRTAYADVSTFGRRYQPLEET
jgi:hypothetical protein